MPPAQKRRRTDCQGDGCGQPGCEGCWLPGFIEPEDCLEWAPIERAGMSSTAGHKRRRTDCHGYGCGHPKCESCWGFESEFEGGDLTEEEEEDAESDSVSNIDDSSLEPSTVAATHGPAPLSTTGTSSNAVSNVEKMITCLDEETVRRLLAKVVSSDKSGKGRTMLEMQHLDHMSQLLDAELKELEERKAEWKERTKVIDFDSYSKSAWYTLNKSSYARGGGSKQYDAAGDAFEEVRGCITSIGEAIKPESSYGSKKSALKTLRKIAKTILLTSSTLGHEVRKQFQYDDCLPEAMIGILEGVSEQDCLDVGSEADEKGSLVEKVEWVF